MPKADFYEITSIKSLRSWLQAHASEPVQWYGRIGFGGSKRLWISRNPMVEFRWDSYTTDKVPMHPMALPSLEDAREWWWRLWEGEIHIFLHREESIGLGMACVAKTGTWVSLSPWYVTRSKDEWEELTEQQFRCLVGNDVCDRMIDESNVLGIATRRLEGPAKKVKVASKTTRAASS